MRYVHVHMKINIFRPSPSSNGVPYLMKLTNETPALDILPLIHRCFSKLFILNHRYFGPRVYPLGSIVIALVRLSVCPSVRPSVRPSLNISETAH